MALNSVTRHWLKTPNQFSVFTCGYVQPAVQPVPSSPGSWLEFGTHLGTRSTFGAQRNLDLFTTSDLALNAVASVENSMTGTVSNVRCARRYLPG